MILPNISMVGELKQMFVVVVVVFISGTSHKISKQEKGPENSWHYSQHSFINMS